MPTFTKVEQRLYDVLSDGEMHPPDDLLKYLSDELGGRPNLRVQISNMRKKLNPVGLDVVCQVCYGRKAFYRMVQLIQKPSSYRA